MNFNSINFLAFLVVVLIFYWILPNKYRWCWLLASSYYFYMSWNAKLIILIIGTTLISYMAGIILNRLTKPKLRKMVLAAVCVICIGLLLFFKYYEFFLGSIIDALNLLSMNIESRPLNIILPIGISFYTFQTLSYVIDVYKGKTEVEKHLGYYALFVSFFPQLVAGPIERPGDLIPQLRAEHYFKKDDFATGFRILLVGFFFKCVVADFAGRFVNIAFPTLTNANGLAIVLTGVLFSIQMYCDFAGYSEIATGVARMMGIKLSRNFNRPELSSCYTDFFHRWHITLTKWFTDYVYIPLGGNRRGPLRKMLNTYIVFSLCGLWHGANWTYVFWGIYAATFLCIENMLKKPFGRWLVNLNVDTSSVVFKILSRLYAYSLLLPACLIFRSQSVHEALLILSRMFTQWNISNGYFFDAIRILNMDLNNLFAIFIFTAAVAVLPRFAELGRDKELSSKEIEEGDLKRKIVIVYLLIAIFLCWVGLLSTGDVSEFQYFQF